MKESIIQLYLSENNLAARYWGVASRLGTDPDKTLQVMREMENEGILFRGYGAYYGLNPPHLWKNQQYAEKYGQKAEEEIINSARDFLLSVNRLVKGD